MLDPLVQRGTDALCGSSQGLVVELRGGEQMSDIRLRDYTARIKELIRDIRLDEAIAHCQQILRHYPKHIETYCLLGEACLEKELYREAIEFFQRTLSDDPENLISRVGLGIIYDEQGALPEAIWQMERAFELAPGNAEVRRELQRMYLQQDGAERFRLKLTRGALGRLYSGNGMYERAIDEFHAAQRSRPARCSYRFGGSSVARGTPPRSGRSLPRTA
jgi:tetratricopeptide (TPR) repeat protein